MNALVLAGTPASARVSGVAARTVATMRRRSPLAVDRERHVGAELVAVAVEGGEFLALGADAVAAVARVARLPQVAPIVRVTVALVSHQPLERVVVALRGSAPAPAGAIASRSPRSRVHP